MNSKFRSACYPSFNFTLCCACSPLCMHGWVQETPLHHDSVCVHRGIHAFLRQLRSQLRAFLALCNAVALCVLTGVSLCVYRIIELGSILTGKIPTETLDKVQLLTLSKSHTMILKPRSKHWVLSALYCEPFPGEPAPMPSHALGACVLRWRKKWSSCCRHMPKIWTFCLSFPS